jgi:hypothetical protein
VRYAVLETCDYDKRLKVERQWMWRFPSSDLLNRLKPWPSHTPARPPTVPEIKKYMRRHVFNVEGLRGIHYDSEEDYYRVWMSNGCEAWWIKGDELPSGGGGGRSIWFSDLAQAVNARDREYPQKAILEARRREDILNSGAREQERFRTEGPDWQFC